MLFRSARALCFFAGVFYCHTAIFDDKALIDRSLLYGNKHKSYCHLLPLLPSGLFLRVERITSRTSGGHLLSFDGSISGKLARRLENSAVLAEFSKRRADLSQKPEGIPRRQPSARKHPAPLLPSRLPADNVGL